MDATGSPDAGRVKELKRTPSSGVVLADANVAGPSSPVPPVLTGAGNAEPAESAVSAATPLSPIAFDLDTFNRKRTTRSVAEQEVGRRSCRRDV